MSLSDYTSILMQDQDRLHRTLIDLKGEVARLRQEVDLLYILHSVVHSYWCKQTINNFKTSMLKRHTLSPSEQA